MLPVPSPALPDDGRRRLALLELEAVRLFVERAQAASPTFHVTAANAASVAKVCRRLDGIPLALELAAARLRALSVEQIAARLDDRFRSLTGGSRVAVPRHRPSGRPWTEHDLLTP
jgi:predicted ATPase